MYLGDSENDNPAFRKSEISIGIHSDTRLNPMLDCKYMINFNRLPLFLNGLIDNDFVLEDLLPVHVDLIKNLLKSVSSFFCLYSFIT